MKRRSTVVPYLVGLAIAGSLLSRPQTVLAANCGTGTASPTCACGDIITQSYTLNGTLQCNCGSGSGTKCLEVASNATLSGSGSLQCSAGSNCTTVGVKLAGSSSTVSGITIQGNGAASTGGGANISEGVYATGASADATLSGVHIASLGRYGVHIDQGAALDISGGTIDDSQDDGIHLSSATASLFGNLSITNSGDSGVAVLSAASGGSSVSFSNVTVSGFAGGAGVFIDRQSASTTDVVTATNLQVDGSVSDCVTARSGASATINNTALRDGNNNPISGLNCPDWLKVTNTAGFPTSTITYSSDIGGMCCCKLDPDNGTNPPGVTLHLTGQAGDPDQCTASCPAGCC